MPQFDENYWYQHICYSMDIAEQPPKGDEGNLDWSRNNMHRILEGKSPFGLTGHKCVVGYMRVISEYYPEKFEQSLKVMIEYIEDIQEKRQLPLRNVHEYLLSLLHNQN